MNMPPNAQWMLRHANDVPQGPYELDQLLDAARLGHLLATSEVLHPEKTKGQWVAVTRVRPIRDAMPVTMNQPPPPPTEPTAAKQTAAESHEPAQPWSATFAFEPTGKRHFERSQLNVPKTFVEALLALFDFRFRYFVTPWIIKIVWVLTVLIAALFLAMLTWSHLSDLLPDPDTQGFWPNVSPRRQSSGNGWKHAAYIFSVWATACFLLMARVALELVFVFFRIAQDLSDVKSVLDHQVNRSTS